ncbi:MAG: transposase [Polyangiaceae bacterium]|nr:transposase [Polyangiaceae bacterium]
MVVGNPTSIRARDQARRYGAHSLRYTPRHASWLNQIEIWFSILQRRPRYGCFADVKELSTPKTFVRTTTDSRRSPSAGASAASSAPHGPARQANGAGGLNAARFSVWCRSRRSREVLRGRRPRPAARAGLTHLRVDAPPPTIDSTDDDPWPCARLRRDTVPCGDRRPRAEHHPRLLDDLLLPRRPAGSCAGPRRPLRTSRTRY